MNKCKDCGREIENAQGLCDRCSIGLHYTEDEIIEETEFINNILDKESD